MMIHKSSLFFGLTVFIVLQLQTCCPQASNAERKNLKTVFDVIHSLGQGSNPINDGNGFNQPSRFDCPLCDSSVYSYCSDKLLHDACCCLNPYEHKLPHQCRYADCSFLHANTCKEHKLITACCCSRLLNNNI